MKYSFKCPQCQEKQEFDLSIDEYTKFKALCKRCKVKMERIYEMPGLSCECSESDLVDCGSADGSCGGSCSSCDGCG